jgi:serine/threonine-protein kinase
MPEPDDTALGPAPPRGSSADASRFGHGQFAPGTVLAGRYRVVGPLGRGGMGEVYRADDLTLGQSVFLNAPEDR